MVAGWLWGRASGWGVGGLCRLSSGRPALARGVCFRLLLPPVACSALCRRLVLCGGLPVGRPPGVLRGPLSPLSLGCGVGLGRAGGGEFLVGACWPRRASLGPLWWGGCCLPGVSWASPPFLVGWVLPCFVRPFPAPCGSVAARLLASSRWRCFLPLLARGFGWVGSRLGLGWLGGWVVSLGGPRFCFGPVWLV